MASIMSPNYKEDSGLMALLKGAGGAYTGMLDLANRNQQASPQGMLTALARAQTGMKPPTTKGLTETLGLQKPEANSPNSFAYEAGGAIAPMPTKAMLSKGAPKEFLKQGLTGIGVSGAVNALDSADTRAGFGTAVGALAAAALATYGRNRMIKNFGVDEVPSMVGSGNLTRGQKTGNLKALREEGRLRGSEDTIDDVFAFDKKQAEKLQANLNKISPNPKNADMTKSSIEASKNIDALFSDQNKKVGNRFAKELGDFFKKIGGENAKFLSSAPVVKKIDEQLGKLESDSVIRANKTAIAELKELRASLVNNTGTPRSFGAKEFQQQFSSWSKRSSNGGGFLADLDRTQAGNISASIASGFDDILTNAASTASNKVKKESAQLLQKARENYKTGKTQLADLEALRVNKLFDVSNVNALDGDTILTRLSKMNPELRQRSLIILDNAAPDYVDNIRKKMFDDIVQSGNVGQGADAAIKFDPSKFAATLNKRLEKDPQLLEFMFPNKVARMNFTRKAKEAGLIGNTQLGQAGTMFNEGTQAAGNLASAAGAGYQGKLAIDATSKLGGLTKSIFTSDKELYDYFFKGADIKSSAFNAYTAQTGKELGVKTEELTRPVEPTAPSLEELMMEDEAQPTQQPQQGLQQPPMQSTPPTLEELMMEDDEEQPMQPQQQPPPDNTKPPEPVASPPPMNPFEQQGMM